MSHPNWGSGAKDPVLMFTEDEIREVMKHHRPGNEGYCLCAWAFRGVTSQEFNVDHLLDKLKENRHGHQAHLHPNFG